MQLAFNDRQAVTEMYAGLAEQARFYAYAYDVKQPYIPASPIDMRDLENLYQLMINSQGLMTSQFPKQRQCKN